MQVLRQNEVLAKKFFEPWSYVQSDLSMTELIATLQASASTQHSLPPHRHASG